MLVLCWRPGFESRIHNHPAQGCFVMPLRGCICETQYSLHDDGSLTPAGATIFSAESPGAVSFMSDTLGRLHKISNPDPHAGSVTLHLYTPSFTKCRVWLDETGAAPSEERTMGLFSVNGRKTLDEDSGTIDVDYYI